MKKAWVAVATAVACVAVAQSARLTLEAKRGSAQDLAVMTESGGTKYVSYASLSALPQTKVIAKNDLFAAATPVSGLSLDALAAAVGESGGKKQLIAAVGSDGYEGHFTAEYRAAHHPVLALRVNGEEPGVWPHGPNGELLGPYLVTDRGAASAGTEQLPYGVTELKFYDEDAVIAALKPKKASAMAGYRIAMQNCLRCHRASNIGGTKSPFEWPQLAMIAQGNADAFGKYVKQPQRVNPEATMPGNPEYDAATITSITAYFQGQNQ